jgi:hypothetical protein
MVGKHIQCENTASGVIHCENPHSPWDNAVLTGDRLVRECQREGSIFGAPIYLSAAITMLVVLLPHERLSPAGRQTLDLSSAVG